MRVVRTGPALCFALALCFEGTAHGQGAAGQSRLVLGADKGAKGDEVFIPLMLSPAPGAQIAKISATIGFPSEALQFVSAKPGAPPDSRVEVRSEDTPGDASGSMVKVEVESRVPDGIPAGIIGLLTFKVSEQTAAGRTIALDLKAKALAVGGAQVLLAVVAGEIELTQVPVIFACYFYMH